MMYTFPVFTLSLLVDESAQEALPLLCDEDHVLLTEGHLVQGEGSTMGPHALLPRVVTPSPAQHLPHFIQFY